MNGRRAWDEGSRERSDVANCQGRLPPLELKEVRTSLPLEALEEMSHADTFFFFFALKEAFWAPAFQNCERMYLC